MVREEILAGIPDRYLKIIEYNKNIEWEEEGKEFSLDGEFYDILKMRSSKGKTFLYCINDENEELLVKKFAGAVKSSAESEAGKSNKHSFKSPITDQLVPTIISSVFSNYFIQPTYPYYYTASLASHCKEIIIPPPWNAGI